MKYIIATAAAAAVCILLGTALAWLAARRRNMPPRRKALLAAVFSVLLLAVVSLGYLETYYRAGETAKAYLTGEHEQDAVPVSVQKTDTGYFFDGPGESSAVIFYGGAKVEETAYAPLLYRISQRGADCFLVKAPFRVAVTAAGAADKIIQEQAYQDYYLAGHSLGGVAASAAAVGHPGAVKGLILLASYPNRKIPDEIPLLSIYGSEDGCLDREMYEKSRGNHPADTQEKVIEGGNHAQFGDYGPQKGDGTARITPEEQWEKTADAVMNWLGVDFAGTEAEEARKEKPRLVENDEEEATPDRALMKANQVQNSGDEVIYPVDRDKKNEKKDYSVFVYMVGSDLEASYGYATRDMQEMTESGIDFSKTNLLIYAGGSRMWKSDIPSNQNNVLDMSLEGGDRVVAATKNTSDMGAPETLKAFLDYAVTYYPADHYALIFWDHGGGSVYGYGNDAIYSGDSLLLKEMDAVLKESPFGKNGSAHLDWVGFDACLMSTAENAVIWSKYADYMVASEETEPGDGWCYSFMDVLNETSEAEEIGKAIVDAYKAYYAAKRSPLNDPDITLAVLDLKQMDSLVDSIDSLALKMKTGVDGQAFPDMVRSRSSTKTFGLRDSRATAYDLLDIGDLSSKMKQIYPEESKAIETALKAAVIYNTNEVEGSCGLSLYFPGENRELYEAVVSNGDENLYISDEYASFVDLYTEKWTTASAVDWSMPEPENTGAEVTLQLTQEQVDNLDKATYTVLIDEGDGFYRRALCKVEVEPDEKHVLHIPTDPSLIYAAGDFGTMPVPSAFVQSETREGKATYDSMRMFFGYGPEMVPYPYDYVTATVEETDGEFAVKSFSYKDASVLPGGKNSVDLSQYVTLNEYTSDTVYPTRSEDGTMLPYYEWDAQTGVFSAHMLQIDESLHFVSKKASALGSPTVVQVVLRDINGAEHGSEICEINKGTDGYVEYKEVVKNTEKGALTFEIHDKEAWLTSYSGDDLSIEIPSEIDGYPLTRICGNAIQSAYSLRELTIPEGVTSMEHSAVSYVSALKVLTLPSTLENIGRAPIGSAKSLEKIIVNGKSKAVCDKDGVLFSADGKTLIRYPEKKGRFYTVPEGTEEIAYHAFCEADLFEVHFPETLKNIDNYAFERCRNLDALVLPDSLERIGAGAFSAGFTFSDDEEAGLIDLVRIGAKVSEIGPEAFSGYPIVGFEVSEENKAFSTVNGMITSKAGDVLTLCPAEIGGSIIVPDGVVGLTPGVFAQLPSNTAFYFPDSLVRMNLDDFPSRRGDGPESIYDLTIYCSKGSAAETFAVKNELNHVITAPGEIDLKPYTNESVPGLNGVYSFRVYDDHAVFTGYKGNDSSIAIPDTVKGVPVTEIGDGEKAVYDKGSSLQRISFYDYTDDTAEVTNLGNYKSDGLVGVDIPDTVTHINDSAFADISIKIDEFRLPGHLEEIGPKAFGGTYSEASVGRFIITEDNPDFMTKDGVLFTKDGKTLVRFPTRAKTDLAALTIEKDGHDSHYIYQIPDGCETIGRYAFANTELIDAARSMEISVDDFEVRFSPEIVTIEGYAFYDALFKAVEMNEGLESIGEHAFENCRLQTDELILPSTVTSLGDSAFARVYRSVEEGESRDLVYGFRHIELPERLKSVGKEVFASYSDSHYTCDALVIGRKLKDIAEGAFNDFYTTGFEVNAKNSSYSSKDGCLLDGKGETLIAVPQGRQGMLEVPEGVKKIGKHAVYDCYGLTDLYIGPEVTYIHPQAIYIYDAAGPVIHGEGGSEAEKFAVSRGYTWKEEEE
ncbi:MAG: leucine-rich repeat protein [Lachnospiraceae bacterium]|nr:leucine-rich repeat protein [Lachnospiraceae bacterium]